MWPADLSGDEKGRMDRLQMLTDRVRQAGCRITKQRAVILRSLSELDGHASAERVYEQACVHRRDVHFSTVYRTLERLRDLRVISQMDLGRGCAEFEIIADRPHHHLICLECGRMIDLDHSYLEPVAEAIRRDFGFEPFLDHLAILGWCGECDKAERSSELGPERRE